jgi:ATP-dependent DNA helicase PIF1
MFIREINSCTNVLFKKIQVCAMTGCAAVLLECNAKTIHSWSGLGLAAGTDIEEMAEKVSDSYMKKKNWNTTDILIIDEVSMMSKKMFELLELTARKCRSRRSHLLFGGMQLVFCGDFYQLPPIGERDEEDSKAFCFESDLFDSVFENKIEFTKSFRQAGDQVYTKILNQIRVGRLTKSTVEILNKRINAPVPDNINIKPTRIYPTRLKVDRLNQLSMKNLPGESKTFKMTNVIVPLYELAKEQQKVRVPVTINYDREFTYMRNGINCPQEITLKIGAQVMCIVNVDVENTTEPICNGSQGIIVGFNAVTRSPNVKFVGGFEKEVGVHTWVHETYPSIQVKQLPIVPAWAMTTHKSQGTSLDFAEIDVGGDIFACGQTYVALSRVRSLAGLYLKSFEPGKIKVNKKVKQFYDRLHGVSTHRSNIPPPKSVPAPVPEPSHYETLGVSVGASAKDIKSAYHAMALKYHPDKNRDDGAEDIFKKLSLAYETLADPEQRTAYDLLHAV